MTVAPVHPHPPYTLKEYLEFEETSPIKHEFHNGEILAMSGASPEHALITANTIAALHSKLRNTDCRVYSSDLKIAVGLQPEVQYPDASIICGPPVVHPADLKNRLVINPRVIVEVLSPTTEAYDRGEKFRQYRTLESLEEYILISQTAPQVETFVRHADRTWIIAETFSGLDARARLRSIQVELSLADIFAGITFPPPAANMPNDFTEK